MMSLKKNCDARIEAIRVMIAKLRKEIKEKVMEREALIAKSLNDQMKFRAFPRQIYVI